MAAGSGVARLALLGVAIGRAAALTMTRLMRDLLYGVSATDPGTLIGVALTFVAWHCSPATFRHDALRKWTRWLH